MPTTDDYLGKVTPWHRGRPRFAATLAATVERNGRQVRLLLPGPAGDAVETLAHVSSGTIASLSSPVLCARSAGAAPDIGAVERQTPASFDSVFAGQHFYGFAHGTAGIGYFLLAAADTPVFCTALRRDCRVIAEQAADTLLNTVLDDDDDDDGSESEEEKEETEHSNIVIFRGRGRGNPLTGGGNID